jgi:hypothetical protein
MTFRHVPQLSGNGRADTGWLEVGIGIKRRQMGLASPTVEWEWTCGHRLVGGRDRDQTETKGTGESQAQKYGVHTLENSVAQTELK